MPKILVIEDDLDLAAIVKSYLLFEHYEVEMIHDGREGLERVRSFEYDIIVTDVGLPNVSGIEIVRALRIRGKRTPVIILTGKNTVDEKEAGLDAGADDYVTKPFHMKELGARLRALLRRPISSSADQLLVTGCLTLNRATYCVTRSGEEVTLKPSEFQLLEFLMRHPNQTFGADVLVQRVWPDEEMATPALRTTMKRLRQKIDPSGDLIKTVHGSGYILKTE